MAQSHTATIGEKQWLNDISEIGCIICNLYLHVYSPAEPHHLIGKVKKGSHNRTIPLCPRHHRNPGKGYVSLADGIKPFEKAYGTEEYLLEKTKELVERHRANIIGR